jgi:hypothetical protein
LVVERFKSVGAKGPADGGSAGEVTGASLVPWEAIDVAAVEVRVFSGPEFVDDDVSLF